jgi:hypothetical protein
MFFDSVNINVFRKQQPGVGVVNWGTTTMHTYVFSHTVVGTPQPFTGDEGLHSDQLFANVRDLIVFDDPEVDIIQGDELEYHGEKHRVQFVQRYRLGLIPHTEVFTTETQWVR